MSSTEKATGPLGSLPDQDPTSGFWRFRISKSLEVCLSYNPSAYKPVLLRLAKPFVVLNDEELDQLTAFLFFTERWLKQNKGYQYKWTTRNPATARVQVRLRHAIGRVEKGFRSRRDVDLSLDT